MVAEELLDCSKLENMLFYYDEFLGITLNDKIHKNFVISIPTSVSYLGVNIDIAQSWLHGLIWGLKIYSKGKEEGKLFSTEIVEKNGYWKR